MKGMKRILALDTVGSSVFSAVLSGVCSALWFYPAFRHGAAGAPDCTVQVITGTVWLASAAIWGLRAYRAHKNKEEAP